MKLGIGICARNEEAGIISTVTSVVTSVQSVAYPLDWELVVCANGCIDRTPDLIRSWLSDNRDLPVSLVLLDTANLVEAQRLIASSLKERRSDMLAFFDADVSIGYAVESVHHNFKEAICGPAGLDECHQGNRAYGCQYSFHELFAPYGGIGNGGALYVSPANGGFG